MFKPLLASPADLSLLEYPLLASPKLDGIRAVMRDGVLLSRKLLPIPNQFIQSFASQFPDGLDGELMTYDADGAPDPFNTVQGNVMRREGEPNFKFVVFDDCSSPDLAYKLRMEMARRQCAAHSRLEFLTHSWLADELELMAYENRFVDEGYEGMMLRDPVGRYKFGRSTAKEQILLKVKRFHDAEAVVIGKVELMSNQNAKLRDELGHAKRSSAKAGKVPAGTMGALKCSFNGIEFEIGTGFDKALRQAIWDDPTVLGRKVTFKYQELSKDGVPRFPVFVGFRYDI